MNMLILITGYCTMAERVYLPSSWRTAKVFFFLTTAIMTYIFWNRHIMQTFLFPSEIPFCLIQLLTVHFTISVTVTFSKHIFFHLARTGLRKWACQWIMKASEKWSERWPIQSLPCAEEVTETKQKQGSLTHLLNVPQLFWVGLPVTWDLDLGTFYFIYILMVIIHIRWCIYMEP